jgi:hypothetical protein
MKKISCLSKILYEKIVFNQTLFFGQLKEKTPPFNISKNIEKSKNFQLNYLF